MKNVGVLAFFLCLLGLNVFLTFNYHSHGSRQSYHGALWADRGGYFVYLPATFQYGFDAAKFPAKADSLAGHGFTIDNSSGVVRTKYTYGVALLELPFYLTAHGIGAIVGGREPAFGDIDHAVVCVASPVLVTVGIYLLFLLLRIRHNERTSLMSVFSLFAGSNLFFYTVGDPGMSHAFSFFLFAALLSAQNRAFHETRISARSAIILGALAGLILLVRPTNIIFLVASLFVGFHTLHEVVERSWKFLSPSNIAWAALAAALVWLPQFVYWKYAFGSYLTWPYTNEGFTELTSPKFDLFWFSTNNGALPYAPIFLLILVGMGILWRSGEKVLAVVSFATLMLVSYLSASWWVWHFGCGFGSRTLVEYFALFVFPFAATLNAMKLRWGRLLPVLVVLTLVIFELKITYSHGACWFEGDWNWSAYGDLIFGPTK